MIKALLKRGFAVEKYFKDTSYKSYVSAIAVDEKGTLSKICGVFSKNKVNLSYVRTHFENFMRGSQKKYRIEMSYHHSRETNIQRVRADLKQIGIDLKDQPEIRVPWFPRSHADVNQMGLILQAQNVDDTPTFTDMDYRKRRDQIADIAIQYKMGQPIPNVQYSQVETDCWTKITGKLNRLLKQSMCSRFLVESERLEKNFKLSQRIPQLSELSEYLHSRTGFRIKPTSGILSQREFLNAFAFKLFCSTQYLRHHATSDYTPEPDIVHEIVGHVPMFADQVVADLSHKIGLLSLGASDDQVKRLGALYWFTLEFGVCKEKDSVKGYGAGIASSIGQIEVEIKQYSIS